MGASKSKTSPNVHFIRAIKIGNLALSQEFVEAGASVEFKDKEGNTALALAVTNGSRLIIEWLISTHHVNLNVKNKDGCTPLMYAASVGHIDILKYLVEKGCIIDETNSDLFTALHWSAYVGNIDAVKSLIHLGANVHAKNIHGQCPKDMAETHEIIQYLTTVMGSVV